MLEQGYWIMPNKVLYSTELSDKQKLLYCLISSLCAEKGYCRAKNEYIAEKLWTTTRTIREHVSELQEKWFITVELKNNNERFIRLAEREEENSQGGGRNLPGGEEENFHPYIYTNITNEYSFQKFWEDYPHARKGKKKDSEKYFKQNDSEEVRKQVQILKRQIKAWLQDWKYIPACERWIRDFTPLNEDVIKQDLVKICKRHLNAWGDMKQRSMELKETFWEQQINEIVKAIQKKDSPKILFTNP